MTTHRPAVPSALDADRRRLALVPWAAAAALATPVQGADVIRYGGDDDFAPFESLDAQGRPQGFQVDLLQELGRVLKAEVQVTLQPWAQTEAAFREGRLDLVAMVDTRERRAWAQFTRSHATPAFALYHRRDRPEVQALKDLAGQRVAVLGRAAMKETLQTLMASVPARFVPVADARQALQAVQRGDADVALLARAYGDRTLAEAAVPDVVAGSLNFMLQAYAFAVPPDQSALLARVQSALDELDRNGRLEELRKRWLSSHRDQAQRDQARQGLALQREWTWGVAAVSAVGLAMLGAAAWRRGQRVVAERRGRHEAEAALARAEELLARSFTHNPEPMLIVNRDDGLVRDANDALLTLLGVPADRLIGQPLRAQDRHVDAQVLESLVAALDSDGALAAAPLRLTRADGAVRECLVSADRMSVGGAQQVFCIVRDITEQLQRDAALRQGYDTLVAQVAQAQQQAGVAREGQVRAEAALADFTRAVAHDLRTPLNAVQGFIGLLRARLKDGHVQEALGYSEHIDRAAQRMNAMITALARLSQTGRQTLQRTSVDMARQARDTWTLLAMAHPQRRVDCRIETLPVAQADPDLVAQVWQNLLDNAWKYSAKAAEARVKVDSFRDERGTWYRVADNGAGFDMARAQQLFVPFQRMHSEAEFAGTGVGLSLVKRIVEHHQGEIRVRSARGVGTVVEFTLTPPAAAPAAG